MVLFLRLNQKWGRCRVSAAFDYFLLKNLGAKACADYKSDISRLIRRVPFAGDRINEAGRFLRVVNAFAQGFPTVRGLLPSPSNETLDELLKCARDSVKILIESDAVTDYDMTLLRGALYGIYHSVMYYFPTPA
ncbi:hypothetical protein niasHT_037856 [Heterodera trifolii]|uniref:Uncharacterized protein n=1 Tax=Heterodera trifolii TaxID=157864 RepID=A0ABD2J615_9BILA